MEWRRGIGRPITTLAVAILAGAVALAGCGRAQTTQPAQPSPAQPGAPAQQSGASNKEPIRIGVVTSLTGPLAATGQQVATGVRHAALEWKAKGGVGGRPIEVIVEDDAGNPSTAVNAFNKLISQSKPVAVFAPTFTPLVMAMEPSVKQAKIPVFTSATGPVVTKSGDGWFFRLRTNDEKQGVLAGTYAVQELKAKKPAILYPNNDYGKGGYGAIKATLEKAGVKLVAEQTYNQGDKDVTAQLLNVKRAGADLLIAWTVPTDSGLIAVQAAQLGLGIPIFGGPGFGTPEYLALAKEATNGIHVLIDAAVGFDSKSQPFVEAVKKNFKDVPVSFVVSTAYDGAVMLFNAIQRVGTDAAKLREALLATKNHAGVTGPYSFDAQGNGLHQGVLGKWENQKLIPLKTMNLN